MRRRILVNLTEQQTEEIDLLVRNKVYRNRSDAIRVAIVQFLEKIKLEEIEKKLK